MKCKEKITKTGKNPSLKWHWVFQYKPHSSRPCCSGKLYMWFGMPSGRIVSFCVRIRWVFQTDSLKTSRSFCISGIMMNARSILYDWTGTQQNKHVAGLQPRLFYVKLAKKNVTFPNRSCHVNGFLYVLKLNLGFSGTNLIYMY